MIVFEVILLVGTFDINAIIKNAISCWSSCMLKRRVAT